MIVGRIDTIEELQLLLKRDNWSDFLFQGLDLTLYSAEIRRIRVTRCIFLGCQCDPLLLQHLSVSNHLFPSLDSPYQLFRTQPYRHSDLFNGFDPAHPESYHRTYDYLVYQHFKAENGAYDDMYEELARTLHDYSMRMAMHQVISHYAPHQVVAVMGGHSMPRGSEVYRKVCHLSKQLTEAGYLMISGGGPGAMEATHVGAWLAGHSDNEMERAIDHLATAPSYRDTLWLSTAYEVLAQYPESRYRSLSIPTWLYGHEPPTPFATDICKLFDNSLREEGLLALAVGGIYFAPGSAGTLQEVFQDLAQNHYKTYGKASPMIFIDRHFWSREVPLFPLLQQMQAQGRLAPEVSLYLADDLSTLVALIIDRTV